MTTTRTILAVATFVGVGVALFLLLSDRESYAGDAEPASAIVAKPSETNPGTSASLGARSVDSARLDQRGELSRGGLRLEDARALAQASEDLGGLWLADPKKWQPFVELTHQDRMLEARYKCGEHLRGLENAKERPCSYEISVVVRPDTDKGGAFDYANTHHPPDEDRPACFDYAACLAEKVWGAREDYPAITEARSFLDTGKSGDFLSKSEAELEECIEFTGFLIEETQREIEAQTAAKEPTEEQAVVWQNNLEANRGLLRNCEFALEYKREHG